MVPDKALAAYLALYCPCPALWLVPCLLRYPLFVQMSLSAAIIAAILCLRVDFFKLFAAPCAECCHFFINLRIALQILIVPNTMIANVTAMPSIIIDNTKTSSSMAFTFFRRFELFTFRFFASDSAFFVKLRFCISPCYFNFSPRKLKSATSCFNSAHSVHLLAVLANASSILQLQTTNFPYARFRYQQMSNDPR